MTEVEMVGWHYQLNGCEFEQTPGNSEGQGSLACCSPWGHKESGITEQLNNLNHHLSLSWLGVSQVVTTIFTFQTRGEERESDSLSLHS